MKKAILIFCLLIISVCKVESIALEEVWSKELPYSSKYSFSSNGIIGVANSTEYIVMNEGGKIILTGKNRNQNISVTPENIILYNSIAKVSDYSGNLLWSVDRNIIPIVSTSGGYIIFLEDEQYYIYSKEGKKLMHFNRAPYDVEFVGDEKYLLSTNIGLFKIEDDQLKEFVLRKNNDGLWQAGYLRAKDSVVVFDDKTFILTMYNQHANQIWQKSLETSYMIGTFNDSILLFGKKLIILDSNGEFKNEIEFKGRSMSTYIELPKSNLLAFSTFESNKGYLYFIDTEGEILYQGDLAFSTSIYINAREDLLFTIASDYLSDSTVIKCYKIVL